MYQQKKMKNFVATNKNNKKKESYTFYIAFYAPGFREYLERMVNDLAKCCIKNLL